jgi:hypothetical protein
MPHARKSYKSVRKQMRPGDIIAFSGKGHFSEIIKFATRAPVSHVGIVFETRVTFDGDTPEKGIIVDVFESATLHENRDTGERIAGVQRNRLSTHVTYYEGDMWWLPLSDEVRAALDLKKFTDFLMHLEGRPYDLPQAIGAGLDFADALFPGSARNDEDFAKLFCSELACAALEKGEALRKVNASEVTPIDLCRFSIFAPTYTQIKGDKKPIPGYNSVNPTGFGQ